MKKQLHQLSMTAVGVILLTLGTWSKAATQAATIRADFLSELYQVNANVPGIGVGSLIGGTILYKKVPNEEPIPLDFTLSIGNKDFTFDDVTQIRISDWEGTGGFDAQATLKATEGLGDWSEGISFEMFQEFGDSNFYINSISGDYSTSSIGSLYLNRQELPPVPEPEMLAGTVVAGAVGWWLRRKRKVSGYSATV